MAGDQDLSDQPELLDASLADLQEIYDAISADVDPVEWELGDSRTATTPSPTVS